MKQGILSLRSLTQVSYKNSGKEEKVFKSHWVTQCNSLSVAAKQSCAKASLRSLLAEEEETHSDPEEESDVSDI